jgi:hypothetical protein
VVSQLLKNDKISFVVSKPFTSRGKDYEVGDDFPQEDARDIEVFVRARFVIPVVDSIEDKQFIRHWHTEIRPKDEVLERLNRDRVQLKMPQEYDSDDEVNLQRLTYPETTPDGEELAAEKENKTPVQPLPEDHDEDEMAESGGYDPGEHTIAEVQEYVTEHPDQTQAVRDAEVAGRNRVTLVTWLDQEWEE